MASGSILLGRVFGDGVVLDMAASGLRLCGSIGERRSSSSGSSSSSSSGCSSSNGGGSLSKSSRRGSAIRAGLALHTTAVAARGGGIGGTGGGLGAQSNKAGGCMNGGNWLKAPVLVANQSVVLSGTPVARNGTGASHRSSNGRSAAYSSRDMQRKALADNQVAVRTNLDGSSQDSSSRVVRLEQLVNVGKIYREVNNGSELLTGVQGHLQPSPSEDGVDKAKGYLERMEKLIKSIRQDVKRAEASGLLLRVFEDDVESVRKVVDTALEITERLERTSARLKSLLPQEDEFDEDSSEKYKSVEEIVKQLKAFDLQTMQGFAGTLRRVWMRLNGKKDISMPPQMALDLPKPPSQKQLTALKESELLIQVEELEHLLDTASSARESRLRQKGTLARTMLAAEIRALDDQVNETRKKLAVRTLQLQMERIFGFLEQELLDVSSDLRVDGIEDTMVIVLEYGILEKRLLLLRKAVDRDEAIFIEDEVLAQLAQDIPELKNTLGIIDETTAVDLGKKVVVTVKDASLKIKEGANFYSRGMKLMASDVQYAANLFVQAVLGSTLKPREVRAMRRTMLDLLTLVPFTIILITPMTPVGHVLVFSFIQRYFPSFFPSPFTNKRQLVMLRYESIREQLARISGNPDSKDSEAKLAAIVEATGEAITIAQLRELGGSALPLELLLGDDDEVEKLPRQSEIEARQLLNLRKGLSSDLQQASRNSSITIEGTSPLLPPPPPSKASYINGASTSTSTPTGKDSD